MALLDAEVMIVDLESEADFLQLRVRLVAASIAGFLGGFVLVLAVIHELCDGRLSVRRNLNQVKPGLFGQTQRILNADDADLFTSGSHEANLGDSNTLIDASLADERLLPQNPYARNEKPPLRDAHGGFHRVNTHGC